MQILFYIILFILGACLGSFLCCQARRLHLKEQKSKQKFGARSVCLHCHYQLKWYDNIPIISWLVLGGECRKCHHKIGIAELLAEIGLALAFFGLGTTIDIATTNPLAWAIFIITLLLTLSLSLLAIYDGIYGELPTKFLKSSVVLSVILLIFKEYSLISASSFQPEYIYKPLLSVIILGGLYLALYKISKGKWVGDGDWILGLSLGLAIYDPWLALIILFLANLLACLVMYPIVRRKKHARIYFGPFMVIAFVVTLVFADFFFYAIGM